MSDRHRHIAGDAPSAASPAQTPAASIREEYETRGGADAFYREAGRDYRNPHEPIVQRLLEMVVRRWPLDLSNVLDLAAGSGEVTLALRPLGAGRIDAVDPFTTEAYRARTGAHAEQWSFEEIAAGAMAGRAYSLVICSFALHLCAPSRLPGVVTALSQMAPSLLILTPHKRPILRPEWGYALAGEETLDRVRALVPEECRMMNAE